MKIKKMFSEFLCCHKYKLCIVWKWFKEEKNYSRQNICFLAIPNFNKSKRVLLASEKV